MHPDDAAHDDQRHRREEHQSAVRIEAALGHVPALGDDPVAQEAARTEKLAEEGHDHQNQTVAQTVADTVEERRPGLVSQRESLDAAHDDTVGDDQSDVDRQLLRDFVNECFEHLIDEDHQRGDDDELDDDADARGNAVAQQRHHQVREGRDDRHGQGHDDGGLELYGDGQRRADTEDLHDDRVVRRERPRQVFEVLGRKQRLFFHLTHCFLRFLR